MIMWKAWDLGKRRNVSNAWKDSRLHVTPWNRSNNETSLLWRHNHL